MNHNGPGRTGKMTEAEAEAVCHASIFSADEESYGAGYKDHLLAQYRLFVESVNYTSELKLKTNTYFLTINTALIAATGVVMSRNSVNSLIWHLLLPLAGLLISFIWWGVTYSYKQRNVIKLRIIHCIEEELPLALYGTEWRLMDEKHASPLKKFLFRIDLFIPWVFIFSYTVFILFA